MSLSRVLRHKWNHLFLASSARLALFPLIPLQGLFPLGRLSVFVCALLLLVTLGRTEIDAPLPLVVFGGRTFLTLPSLLPSSVPHPSLSALFLPSTALFYPHVPFPLLSLLSPPSSLPGAFHAIILQGDSQALYPREETAHEMQKGLAEELANRSPQPTGAINLSSATSTLLPIPQLQNPVATTSQPTSHPDLAPCHLRRARAACLHGRPISASVPSQVPEQV